MTIMMPAVLLSIFMDIAWEKNYKLLQTESLAGHAWCPDCRHQSRPGTVGCFSSSARSFTTLNENEPLLSHGHEPCMPTDSAPHSSAMAAPWRHVSSSSGWLCECLHRHFPKCLATKQLLQVLPPSIHPGRGAAEQSSPHSFLVGKLAASQGSWSRLVRRCVTMYLYSDYHPCNIATG